jgi:hypothetical protein
VIKSLYETRVGKNWPLLLGLGAGRVLIVDSTGGTGWLSEDEGRTRGESFKIKVTGVDTGSRASGPVGDLGSKELIPTTISSLCRLSDGRIGAILRITHTQTGFFTSTDDGRTFTGGTPFGLPGEQLEAINGLVQLQSGRLLAATNGFIDDYEHPEYKGEGTGHDFRGAYGIFQGRRMIVEGHDHTPEFYWTQVFYSDDLGRSWNRSPNKLWAWLDNPAECSSTHSPLGEPVVVEVEKDHVLMMMRSVLGRIFQSESFNGGKTWSIPKATGLSASGSPCMVRKIPATGDLLIAWNQVSAEEIRRGLKRCRMSCAISKDKGRSWDHFKTLDVCGGLSAVGKIEPSPVRNYRALDDVGKIPDDFGNVGYPDIAFMDHLVLFGYGVHEVKPVSTWTDQTIISGERDYYGKIKAVAIQTLYQ